MIQSIEAVNISIGANMYGRFEGLNQHAFQRVGRVCG